MNNFKIGECVEILTGKYRGDFGRVYDIKNNNNMLEVELDYSYIINISKDDVKKDI